MFDSEEEIVTLLLVCGVVAFYVSGWTLQSFQANCSNFDKPCSVNDQKELGKASASVFAVSAGFALIGMLMLAMKYNKMRKRGLSPLF